MTGANGGSTGGDANVLGNDQGVRGGGVSVFNQTGATPVTIGSSVFTSNSVTGGKGGNDGNGGSAFGGAIDVSATTNETVTLDAAPGAMPPATRSPATAPRAARPR